MGHTGVPGAGSLLADLHHPGTSGSGTAVRAAVLIVDVNPMDLSFATSTLAQLGFELAAVDNFREARALLTSYAPAVLLTEIRLGAFNGLQLVIQAKEAHPRMAALVTSRYLDPVLQADAGKIGATFVPKPIGSRDLLAAVLRTIAAGYSAGDPAIRPPFERRFADRRTHLPAAVVGTERRQAERRASTATILHRAALLTDH